MCQPRRLVNNEDTVEYLVMPPSNFGMFFLLTSTPVHWSHSVLKCQENLNISHQIMNGSLEFVDVMKQVQLDFCVPASLEAADLHTPPTLCPLFDLVQGILHKMDHGDAKLVTLDDIATLEWIGFLLLDVSRFACALWGAHLKVHRLPPC